MKNHLNTNILYTICSKNILLIYGSKDNQKKKRLRKFIKKTPYKLRYESVK